ncbi:hypothetical protein PM082_011439 [Marasmius tenuissimus]|nr:hypothetical protein PM082_011439 [Marasmius tenuissimus]
MPGLLTTASLEGRQFRITRGNPHLRSALSPPLSTRVGHNTSCTINKRQSSDQSRWRMVTHLYPVHTTSAAPIDRKTKQAVAIPVNGEGITGRISDRLVILAMWNTEQADVPIDGLRGKPVVYVSKFEGGLE